RRQAGLHRKPSEALKRDVWSTWVEPCLRTNRHLMQIGNKTEEFIRRSCCNSWIKPVCARGHPDGAARRIRICKSAPLGPDPAPRRLPIINSSGGICDRIGQVRFPRLHSQVSVPELVFFLRFSAVS